MYYLSIIFSCRLSVLVSNVRRQLKINNVTHVPGIEGQCLSTLQCDSLMCLAQRNELYPALVKQEILVSRINSLLVLVFLGGFVDNKKSIQSHRNDPLSKKGYKDHSSVMQLSHRQCGGKIKC